MQRSLYIPSGSRMKCHISTLKLMQHFANGSYIILEDAPGSDKFIDGKIVGIQCESGYKDGLSPDSFIVTLQSAAGNVLKAIFVRTTN